MSIISIIGTDCLDIITDYKTDLEKYQKQLSDIYKCSTHNEDMEVDYTECPIVLSDFKNYFRKYNLTNKIRFMMKCYNDNRDYFFFDLDFNREVIEDSVLQKTEIIKMIKIYNNNTIYLEFAPYKLESLVRLLPNRIVSILIFAVFPFLGNFSILLAISNLLTNHQYFDISHQDSWQAIFAEPV